jgi:fibronectin type 3 domain-containing protein
VSGYNVYRSTTPGGGYTKLNTSLITETSYQDTGLDNGTTYYYVVTSVVQSGFLSSLISMAPNEEESVPSHETNGTPIDTGSGSGGCFIASVSGHFLWD